MPHRFTVCRTDTHKTRLGIPRYGIPYYQLDALWTEAERLAHGFGRTRAWAHYAVTIRRTEQSSASAIGRASIALAHLCGDDTASLRRAMGVQP